MSKQTSRTISAQITYAVIYKKDMLSSAFAHRLTASHSSEIKSTVKSLCFETIRLYPYLQDMWLSCIDKNPKDKLLRVLMSQAMAELVVLKKPKHVVVNEAINSAKKLNKKWACGLINSTLRKAVERSHHVSSNESAQFAHPQWMIDAIKSDWPEHWQSILKANNKKPPLWIRSINGLDETVNTIAHQQIKCAYKIDAQDITKLPEFQNGSISVQDASAQLAAIILDPQDNEKILDACAAPGGKTCHLLGLNGNIELDALEIFENRAKKIAENLQRLGLSAKIKIGDARNFNKWFEGNKYDKILLDAPCSATGIIRRQPDIKYLRKPEDLKAICQDQQEILSSVAETLHPQGTLLYATCSVLKAENSDQIKIFLNLHPEFSEIKLSFPFATECEYGIQILTGQDDMDGFYYCYLKKNAD